MKRSAFAWMFAGLVVGYAGLATSFLTAKLMNLRVWPVTAIAELMVDVFPSSLVNWAKDVLGTTDKPALVVGIVVIVTILFALIGRLARLGAWPPAVAYLALAAFGGYAMLDAHGAKTTDLLPIVVGFVTWVAAMALLAYRINRLETADAADPTSPQRASSRREFLIVVGAVAAISGVAAAVGKLAGRKAEEVEQVRKLGLRNATKPVVPQGANIGVKGVEPWMTPVDEFYLIDTAFAKPAILPAEWSLRIHGMVDREITLSYEDLVQRGFEEAWITLNCVSNEIGGDLIGNAWWTGVALKPLLEEAGIQDGADAVKQTSDDGWTCGTPLDALLDPNRKAMLAVGMNGEPLTIEHGFPVRTVVPGLYGYVSACKWVVDMEVTRFDDFDAFWTEQGWGELGPVKMASRIDVPRSGDDVAPTDTGEVVIAGSAWHQHVGIEGVEISVDQGEWTACEIGATEGIDSWVQWRASLPLASGEHEVRVRATDRNGEVQTGEYADVLPDGATGWHTIEFTVS